MKLHLKQSKRVSEFGKNCSLNKTTNFLYHVYVFAGRGFLQNHPSCNGWSYNQEEKEEEDN